MAIKMELLKLLAKIVTSRMYDCTKKEFYDFFKDDLGSPTNATFMLANGFAYYTEN